MTEVLLNADRPADEDLLERGPLVDQLAGWVLGAPASDGFVIGVTGPWGSGKTTVLGLLEKRLAGAATVIRFDPWLFSTADDLVLRFFEEVAATLARKKGKDLKKVARGMADFGAALSPAAAVVLGPAGQLLAAPKRLADLKQSSAASQRRALREALHQSRRRIVVLIDDIDRLETREIREIMRLVKLVADLPGIVHVLGYERSRVERAVEGPELRDGRAYLEKIVQAHATVPPVRAARLRTLSTNLLERAIGARTLQSWDDRVWLELLVGGIDGYLETMRHGHQLANMAPGALDRCADEVASMDVIALEAMRIFDPNVHEALPSLVDILVGQDDLFALASGADKAEAEKQRRLDEALKHSSRPVATRHLLSALFPATAQHLGGSRGTPDSRARLRKRVAAQPVLMRYLHMDLAADEAPAATVDEAIAALASSEHLRTLLDDVVDERLADLLQRAIARLDEQPQPDLLGCSRLLLGLQGRMSGSGGGYLDVSGADRVRWLVQDLVKTVQPLSERREVARTLVDDAPTLSQRMDLLYAFKARSDDAEDPDLALFDTATTDRLARQLATDTQACDAATLVAEGTYVFWLLGIMHEQLGADAVLAKCKEQPVVLRAMLQSIGTEVRPRTGHGVSLHVAPLVRIAGAEVLDALRVLAETDTDLEPGVRTALHKELDDGPTDV